MKLQQKKKEAKKIVSTLAKMRASSISPWVIAMVFLNACKTKAWRLRPFLNTKYAKFGHAYLVVRTW